MAHICHRVNKIWFCTMLKFSCTPKYSIMVEVYMGHKFEELSCDDYSAGHKATLYWLRAAINMHFFGFAPVFSQDPEGLPNLPFRKVKRN